MIRISGGEFKGRELATPKESTTRPTLAKVRQALFNAIQFELSGASVLDLFAGSGALGFEALSRGATFATFVEASPRVCQFIKQNAKQLQVMDRIRIINCKVDHVLKSLRSEKYEIVFADPPYDQGWEAKLFAWPWGKILKENGLFSLEWSPIVCQTNFSAGLPEQISELPDFHKIREKAYGDTTLTLYRLEKQSKES